MVDQTTLENGALPSESPPRAVARNTAELMSDVLTLAELQGRLLVIDVESGIGKIIPLAVTLLAGAVLAASCLPIALATIALALVELTTLSMAQAFACSLLGGALISLLLVAVAFWQFRAGLGLLKRSQSEWQQNLKWIKNTLQRMGRSGVSEKSVVREPRW